MEDDKFIIKEVRIIESIQNKNTEQLNQTELTDKLNLVARIKNVFQLIRHRMQTVRELKNKTSYALSKLEEKRADALSKDHFLMNHLKPFLYLCSNTISHVAGNLNDLCEIMTGLNRAGKHFVRENKISLHSQQNYAELMEPNYVSRSLNVETSDIPTKYLKQRSPEWFAEKQTVKVTVSTVFTAIVLDTERTKGFFDKTISDVEVPKIDAQILAMNYGTQNEANAVATLVACFLP